jgi:DnaK suppressor protein
VKPQPKAAAKSAKAAAPAKSRAAAKAPAKKAAAKSSKPAAKPAAKAVAKAPARPKAAVKAPAKPVAKTAVKAASKAVAKPAAKPAAKAAPKAPAKAAAKPAAKPAAKAPAKAPVKQAAAKAPATSKSTARAPAPAAPSRTAASAPRPAPAPARPAPPATPVAAAPVRAPAPARPADPPRAARQSARLAEITVPSMPQAVASTAPKASYIQSPAPSVPTPTPLAQVKKDPKLANNWKSKSADELSDAEVLAMPDAEYMNDKQLAFFRRKLVQLKQDILNNAGETTEHLREDTVIVPDPADRATIEEEHALELRTRDRERKLLKKIEQSIARIDAGDYGYCDETGEPIGVGRLLARPTATLSLEAQQRRELKQKMFGD